ncbi:MAG: hypothetical protein LKE59_11460 [Eubacterium sp.]|jgi:hypothetical protein|nr:hypothetical protein [Eubacterium sp.]MCH4078771.1 hypothetical protein [Eubacterium sp.]
MIDPYENLANAIVLQAVKDYRKALKTLQMNPMSRSANADKNTLERFFLSDWYRLLTAVDGEMLIEKINQEVKE